MKTTIPLQDNDIKALFRRARYIHLSDGELQEYIGNPDHLDEFQTERVRAHIALCPTCEERLALIREAAQGEMMPIPQELWDYAKKLLGMKRSPYTTSEPFKAKITMTARFLSYDEACIAVLAAPTSIMHQGQIEDGMGHQLRWSYREDDELNIIIGFESDTLSEGYLVQIMAGDKLLTEVPLKQFIGDRVAAEITINRADREGLRVGTDINIKIEPADTDR